MYIISHSSLSCFSLIGFNCFTLDLGSNTVNKALTGYENMEKVVHKIWKNYFLECTFLFSDVLVHLDRYSSVDSLAIKKNISFYYRQVEMSYKSRSVFIASVLWLLYNNLMSSVMVCQFSDMYQMYAIDEISNEKLVQSWALLRSCKGSTLYQFFTTNLIDCTERVK